MFYFGSSAWLFSPAQDRQLAFSDLVEFSLVFPGKRLQLGMMPGQTSLSWLPTGASWGHMRLVGPPAVHCLLGWFRSHTCGLDSPVLDPRSGQGWGGKSVHGVAGGIACLGLRTAPWSPASLVSCACVSSLSPRLLNSGGFISAPWLDCLDILPAGLTHSAVIRKC